MCSKKDLLMNEMNQMRWKYENHVKLVGHWNADCRCILDKKPPPLKLVRGPPHHSFIFVIICSNGISKNFNNSTTKIISRNGSSRLKPQNWFSKFNFKSEKIKPLGYCLQKNLPNYTILPRTSANLDVRTFQFKLYSPYPLQTFWWSNHFTLRSFKFCIRS